MTITRVASQGGGVTFDNVSSASRAFPGNVTSGNTVTGQVSKYDPSSTGFAAGNLTKTAGSSTIGTVTLRDQAQNATDTAHNAGVFTIPVTGTGSLTLQVTSTAGSYIVFSTDELAASLGWDSTIQEDTDSAQGNATPQVGGNMTSAGGAAFVGAVAISATGDLTGDLVAQAAFTEIYKEPDGSVHETGVHMIRIVSSGTTDAIESASPANGAQLYAAAGMVLREISSSAPTISGTSSASPQYTETLTITGSNFGASQGAGSVTIGGVSQTVTSWAAGSIDVTVDRGTTKYGVAANIIVTDNGLVSSAPFALTSILPQDGWSFINLLTPAPLGIHRLTATPDVASGDQVAWEDFGSAVTVASDATFSAVNTVNEFQFEVWSPSAWGTLGVQQIAPPALQQLRRTTRQRTHSKLWRREGWLNTRVHRAGWYNKDLILPASTSGGIAVAVDSITLGDSALADVVKVASATDTLTLSDSAVSLTNRISVATDSITLSDSAVAGSSLPAVAVDSITLSATASADVIKVASATDSLSLSDSASADVSKVAAATDSLTLTDSAIASNGTGSHTAVAADTMSLSDSALADVSKVSSASDTLSLSDSALADVSKVATASDSLTLSDSALGASALPAVAVDGITLSDSALADVAKAAQASDTLTLIDSALADVVKVAAAVDSLTLTDSAIGGILGSATAVASDTINLSDSAAAVKINGSTRPSQGGNGGKVGKGFTPRPRDLEQPTVVMVPRASDDEAILLTIMTAVLAMEED